ncbi:MAG: D-hexose-6-phosphate mutarotase [Zetaproteobacteria bacterium]|nr:D-hexose-6-phosphate mutarotase [Zetaproteobacteria bacterium]
MIQSLNAQFAIEGKVQFQETEDGFIFMAVNSELCDATIAVQGAHLMTWVPCGEEPVIWLSPVAILAKGKSIRGGVPICWPWFGAHSSNSHFSGHGFARTVDWKVCSVALLDDGRIEVAFEIADIPSEQWSKDVPATMKMVLGEALEISLITHNHGHETVTVGDALHTYFCVDDIEAVAIQGFDGCTYLDKVGESARYVQEGDVNISREVDRIYFDQGQDIVIDDHNLARQIRIEKRNSHSSIVWNPWIDKSIKMGDFGSDIGYRKMVCVESANADIDVVDLAAGATHELWVRYSVSHD